MNWDTLIKSLAAVAGASTSYLFGGWSEPLSFLVIVIAFDWISGCAASVKEGTGLNSEIGFWGLAKKALIIGVVILAHRADILLGFNENQLMLASIFFYIANEFLSIIENYGRMGLPMPERLKNIVAVLRDRGGLK